MIDLDEEQNEFIEPDFATHPLSDEQDIELGGPPFVPEGEYVAIIHSITKTKKFGRATLLFWFEIKEGKYAGQEVPAWLSLGQPDEPRHRLAITRWWKQVAKVSKRNPRQLIRTEFLCWQYLVKIRTVAVDHHRAPLPVDEYHSVVADILSIISPLEFPK